jgi:hypothetical protein
VVKLKILKKCFWRSVLARIRGVRADGHCVNIETGVCVDCGKDFGSNDSGLGGVNADVAHEDEIKLMD